MEQLPFTDDVDRVIDELRAAVADVDRAVAEMEAGPRPTAHYE